MRGKIFKVLLVLVFALSYYSLLTVEAMEDKIKKPEITVKENNDEIEKNEEELSKLSSDQLEENHKLKEENKDYNEEELGENPNEIGKDSSHKIFESQKLKEENDSQTTVQSNAVDSENPVLKNGVRDDRVKELKVDLAKLGFPVPGNGTTLYGSKTEQKVKEFQKYYGLNSDGVAGPVTLAKIEEILASPFQIGERHKDTIQLKKDLASLGFFVSATPTNLYGTATANQVRYFQQKYGLKVTGIADPVTLAKIKTELPTVLSNGVRHEAVKILKADLKKLGFPVPGNGTTLFGSKTEQKVKEFQKYYGLKSDGIADQATLAKIEEILASPFQIGERHKDTIQLKKDLALLGFSVSSTPTTLYGSATAKQVKDFQKKHGLKVTGIADPVTLAKIKAELPIVLSKGVRHEDVKVLKANLEKLGFPVPGNGTDLYGSATEKKVKEFQKYYGLNNDGVADLETLAKIEEILASPFHIGKRHSDTIQLKKDLASLGFFVSSTPTSLYGSATAKQVKYFQREFGLKVTGIADPVTLTKIEAELPNVLSKGVRHEDVKVLKANLEKLGFPVPGNGTDLYGSATEKKVIEFQKHYGLNSDGIAGSITLSKIDEILASPFQTGKRHKNTIQLKKDLALLGFFVSSTPTNLYGSATAKQVRAFQKEFNLPISGIADEVTLAKIKEALDGRVSTHYNLTLEQALAIQMKVAPQTDSKYAWVSKSYIDKNNKVTANSLNVRKGPGTSNASLGTISKGTEVKVLDEYNGWYAIEYNSVQWVDAHSKDVKYYLNPANFINDSVQRFQFLDLSKTSGASKTALNNYLKDKGILKGQAEAFIEAGRKHGINDVYLISHATLETGNGTSKLAKGIEVGKNKSGNLVLVTNSNKKNLTNIKKVYNMFGIGAYDNCAVECGAKRAYEEGWTTPYKAIVGGAEFIGTGYIKKGQNTLYKMRWNPEAMDKQGTASHQYATDVGWASKQITTMYNLYQQIDDYILHLDIPVYK